MKKFLTLLFTFAFFVHSLQIQANSENSTASKADTELLKQTISKSYAPLLDPSLNQYYKKVNHYYESLESGNLNSTSNSIFGLKGQILLLLEGTNWVQYNLDLGQKPNRIVPFTSVQYSFDVQTQSLIIEAVVGADQNGHNGKVIAKHIIPGFNIAAIQSDKNLVLILEKSGQLHSIPRNFIIGNAFKAPIPVVKNLNGAGQIQLNPNLKTKIEFITRGTRPVNANEWAQDSIRPTLKNNIEVFEAGDLIVSQYAEADIKTRINARLIPYLPVLGMTAVGLKYIYAGAQLVTFDQTMADELKAVLTEIIELKDAHQVDQILSRLSETEIKTLGQFNTQELKDLLSNSETLNSLQNQKRDKMNLSEWQTEFLALQSNAQKTLNQSEIKDGRLKQLYTRLKSIIKKQSPLTDAALEEAVKVSPPLEITDKNYKQFLSQNAAQIQASQNLSAQDIAKVKKSLTDSIVQTTQKILKSPAVTYLMIGAPLLAFYNYPAQYENSDSLQKIKALALLYETLPEVLKDPSYRAPLITSTVIQILLIPLVAVSAWAFKNSMIILSASLAHSQTKSALKIKDFAQKYRSLTTFQVLLSVTNRFYSYILVPYWKVLIDSMLDQKTFFKSLEKGVSPFKTIKANSEIGEILNLKEDLKVGTNKPRLNRNNKPIKNQEAKEKAIELLSAQKRGLENLAWILATKSISEKYEIDPATLWEISKNPTIPQSKILPILNDLNKKKELDLLNEMLIQEFQKIDIITLREILTQIPEEKMNQLYEITKKTAQNLNQMSSLKSFLKQRYLGFKSKAKLFSEWAIKLGEKEKALLRAITPSLNTARDVNHAYVPDQLMVTILPTLVGDMADLSKPEYLAVDADNLTKTSNTQLIEVTSNIYGHLVAGSASVTLLFDTITQEIESNYDPVEFQKIQSNEWSDTFVSSLKMWGKSVLNPRESDIGGVVLKWYKNRFNTIFASLNFTILMRVGINGQTPASALNSFAIGFLLAHKVYGWVWNYIQVGLRVVSHNMDVNKNTLKEIQYKFSEATKSHNALEAEQLYKEAFTESLELYQKNNPQALKKMISEIKALNDPTLSQALVNKNEVQNIDPKIKQSLELIIQLYISHKKGDLKSYESYKARLIQFYNNETNIDGQDLVSLSSENFLKFTQLHPPVPTIFNNNLSIFANTVLGAFYTTYLGTMLAPMLSDPRIIDSPGAIMNAFIACVQFTSVYVILQWKKTWEFYDVMKEKLNLLALRFYSGAQPNGLSLLETIVKKKNAAIEKTKIAVLNPARVQTRFDEQEKRWIVARSCKSLF